MQPSGEDVLWRIHKTPHQGLLPLGLTDVILNDQAGQHEAEYGGDMDHCSACGFAPSFRYKFIAKDALELALGVLSQMFEFLSECKKYKLKRIFVYRELLPTCYEHI